MLTKELAAWPRRGRPRRRAPSNCRRRSHQERALNPGSSRAHRRRRRMASDRVRSTVASLETMSSSQPPAGAGHGAHRGASRASAAVPALPGPSDARGHMRYLHHRVAGAPNNVSREMFR